MMPPRSLFSLLALLLAALACQLPAFSDSAPPGAPPGKEILFQDDFSSPDDTWVRLRDEEGITDYDQDGYRIRVDLENWFFWVNPGLTFDDVSIQVEATKLGGPDENEFGVICRYVDENNFYFFSITSDGFYGITRVVGDDYELIGMQNLRPSNAINTGSAANRLRAECQGNTLRFYVNDMLLAEVQDDNLTAGDIGLIAGTYDQPGVDILFDNLIVTRP